MANRAQSQPTLADKRLSNQELIRLWQTFQDRADLLKERQWTIGTWILTLLSGVAAFSLSQELLSITPDGVMVAKPLPAVVLGLVGLLICAYGWGVIRNYGAHIQRNWDRADRVMRQVPELEVLWKGQATASARCALHLPRESMILTMAVGAFLLLFLAIALIAVLTLTRNLATIPVG